MERNHNIGHPASAHNNPSRRGFLKASAGALGTALASPLILSGAAKSTEANSKLNLAVVGCGGQGRGDMKGLIGAGAAVVAFCDPDAAQIDKARAEADKVGDEASKASARGAKAYDDYRKLLQECSKVDAVLIATPDHWHAPLCKAFMKLGKHIYCEKPLTHSVSEARELRELARSSKIITQMGNQGSASASLRRSTEIIKAGALGAIREIYHWGIGVTAREGNAEGEDPIPQGFNWDLWVGPSAMRPFKKDVYHPFRWRGWFDFGNGGLADFCCHAINLPMRALDLSYPEKLVVNLTDGKQTAGKAAVEFHFPARGPLPPVVLHWQGNGKPSEEIMAPVSATYPDKKHDGILIIGDKGCLFTGHWNNSGVMKLQGDQRMSDVLRHPGTKDIPETLPRCKGHAEEFVSACRGQGKTFSDFDTGGRLTEIGLSAIVALRTGKTIDWDGEKMVAKNAPEADKFIRTQWRTKWMA